MVNLLKLLILGHIHKWKILEKRSVVNHKKEVMGLRIILQCEHCGNVKYRDCYDDE